MDNDPGCHPRQVPTAAPAEDHDDISVRGYLWQLRWIAPGLLVCCVAVWALGKPRGMSLPWAVFLWAILTVAGAAGLAAVRRATRNEALVARRRPGNGLVARRSCALFWIGYALVMAVLSGG